MLAGGAMNPFTLVYLLYLVLAAILLSQSWIWIVTVLSCLGFSSLFIFSGEMHEVIHPSHHHHQQLSLHLYGMLFAFFLVALLVSYFLSKIVGELRNKERRLERLQQTIKSQESLARLATITANIAHELSTPLSTIAIVSHDLAQKLKDINLKPHLLADTELLKSEIKRCQDILSQLSQRTGDLKGEELNDLSKDALIKTLKDEVKDLSQVEILCDDDLLIKKAPIKALSLAISSLLKNALEAWRAGDGQIQLGLKIEEGYIVIEVSNKATLISQEVFERIGEPFFTTKVAGKGLGLGVYLARHTAQQLGGSLSFSKNQEGKITATLTFPDNPKQR
jgi:two-component system sensor histidine kinase RegB